MRLIYSPAACSISPHIVLEEIGRPVDYERVLVRTGAAQTEGFLAINPKGKVPVLILDDSTIVTENPVILQYLARVHPDCGLLPYGIRDEFDALQICEYFCNTVHNFALTRLFRPQFFCDDEQHWHAIRNEGEVVLGKAFDLMDKRLAGQELFFERFSIADATLFFFELHASRLQIDMPDNLQAHLRHLLARESVRTVMARERLDPAAFRLDAAVS